MCFLLLTKSIITTVATIIAIIVDNIITTITTMIGVLMLESSIRLFGSVIDDGY